LWCRLLLPKLNKDKFSMQERRLVDVFAAVLDTDVDALRATLTR
jgi:hypothetical protein